MNKERIINEYQQGYSTRGIANFYSISQRTVQRVIKKYKEEQERVSGNPHPMNPLFWNPSSKPDMVNSPPHYTAGGIETIDYIKAKLTAEEFRGYLKGSCLKYSSRLGKKDALEQDAGKLAWYANKLKETV